MNNIFSPNMIKTYEQCPKKYSYKYLEVINAPQSSLPFEKGKKIHALANYYLQKIKIDRIENALNDDEKEIWELLKSNPFYNKEYFKSEFNLSLRLNMPNIHHSKFLPNKSFWVGGRIDAIVHDQDDYYILDYKTGSTPKNPEYDYQTMIYLLCVDKYLKSYKTLSFVYINLKDKNNYVIKFNEKLKNSYTSKLLDICDKITSDKSYSDNFAECNYCEFSKICR